MHYTTFRQIQFQIALIVDRPTNDTFLVVSVLAYK